MERWNTAGEMVWRYLFEEQEFYASTIHPFPEGGYARCGSLEEQGSGQRYTAAAVAKLSEDGMLDWLHATPYEGWRHLTGAALLPDGSLLVTGRETWAINKGEDRADRPFALRMDAQGTLFWEHGYEGQAHDC